MNARNPRTLWLAALVLLLLGVALPTLMILRMLESTFLLNFVAYTASFLGLMLGIIGSAFYVSGNRRDH